jgi:lipopolysaccharide biosynthesis regulator YciM
LRAAQYITLAIAIALIALLYWGGNTVPPAKKKGANPPAAGAMSQGPNTMKPASFDSIVAGSRKQLPKTAADSVISIENELAATRDTSRMAAVFSKLAGVWERNKEFHMAAYYNAKVAKLENSEKKLTFAGQFFLQLMENENSPSMQAWDAGEAASCLEQSLKIAPDNEETKLALATAYIEGTGEPMRGVQILLAITQEKPGDIPANMLLGRMSIQSGQFDKAVGRFETVLKQEPENKEALYFLAQAYEGKGDKKKAIELLEKCKRIVNNPDFSKEVDQQINSLK